MYKHKITLFFLFCLLAVFFAGCAGREQLGLASPAAQPPEPFGDPDVLTFETSVSLLPLAMGLANGYGAQADARAVGRSAAIEFVTEGRGDIALFGGALPEATEGVRFVVIGMEAIYLITGMDNNRQGLTSGEIYMLFIDGNLFDDWDDDWDDWDDEDWDYDWDEWDEWEDEDWGDDWEDWLEGFEMPAEDIALSFPGVQSRVLFEDLFHLRDSIGGIMQSLVPEDANQFNNDNDVLAFVKNNNETIGVVMASSPPEGVRTLSIDGLYPGDEGYVGQRPVVLAYRTDNPRAAAFVAALEAGEYDLIFADNRVVRY